MVRLVSAWMLVNGLLLAPEWIAATLVPDTAYPWISLEATLIVGASALLASAPWPRPWARAAGLTVGSAVVLASVLTFADLVFWSSLGRRLNLSLDLYLVDAVYRLAVGNLGLARTLLGGSGIALAAGGLIALLAWLLAPPAGERSGTVPATSVRRVGLGLVAGALVLGLAARLVPPLTPRVRAPAAALVRHQASLMVATRAERAAFAAELTRRPSAHEGIMDPFAGLGGRHVVLAYIESYGMAALEDPELAAALRPRLDTMATRLAAAGLHLASGRLASPTLGGQSWYAHGTVLSGLWLSNQQRYELLLRSDRTTLIDDFRRAGYRTATVMPAITTPWPEAVRLGYDEIHTAATIPYSGPPFYWVTMPDQFTWSFVRGLLSRAASPTFIEVGMVSSHAPWTPILPLLDWEDVEDGAAFEPYRLEGYPPEELWWDVAALRAGYAHSIAYSVETMAQFAERFLDDRTLLIVFGDHQAAPWVTGAPGPDVPAHVLARDPALVDPFLDWGFVPGAIPQPGRPVRRMDEFREWFVRAYAGSGLPASP